MIRAVSGFFVLFFMGIYLSACASSSSPVPRGGLRDEISDRWGIEALSIRESAAGYVLDFRYRIVDPGKAAEFFKPKTKPYLIDQASGAVFGVPTTAKVGPLRSYNNPQKDRVYFILFANPGRFIKVGNKVTVVIRDCRLENLVVQ